VNIRIIRGEQTDKRIQECYQIIIDAYYELQAKKQKELEQGNGREN
jgi:hypothetical protein